MAVVFYYGSGSPYAWRVWLALEHKGVSFELRTLSFDAGGLRTPEFLALNPRGRVPVLVDEGFALCESAAIVDYIEERWPAGPRLFAADLRERARQRQMIREADQYFAAAMELLVDAVLFTPPERRSPAAIEKAVAAIRAEAANWEGPAANGFLAGELSAVDFTLYPCAALVDRIGARAPGTVPAGIFGGQVRSWMERMKALAIVTKSWPPHWT